MNKEDVKIKYLIGEYRERPEFPTTEDFLYIMNNWFYVEGGDHFIHEYRGIEKTGNVIFPDDKLQDRLDGNEELTKTLLNRLLGEGLIKINKNTKFTTYYEII
jgi:hypothetical protein